MIPDPTMSPVAGKAHTYDPEGVWRVELDESLSGSSLRLDAISVWCDTTEAENRMPGHYCGQPGCRPCSISAARLECVAQIRALLAESAPQT